MPSAEIVYLPSASGSGLVGAAAAAVTAVSSESTAERILTRETDRFWFKNGYLVENKVPMQSNMRSADLLYISIP
jgi:hypothetical protein